MLSPGKEVNDFLEQYTAATQRPWTKKDYPKIAAWLETNEKPLAVVVEATKRPQFFSPLVPRKTDKGSEGLIGVLLPGVQKCREMANALVARAMLRIAEGNEEAAWQDLLATHRLGRLVGRGATLIEGLVGIAIDQIASRADIVFLDRTKPNAKRIESCLSDLGKLPPLFDLAEKVDLGERYMFLDSALLIDRQGANFLDVLAGGRPSKTNFLADLALAGVDWDPALRTANHWYDRLVAALREKERPTREEQLDQIEADLKDLRAEITKAGSMARIFVSGKKAKGEMIGNILVTLMIPAVRKIDSACDRARQVQDNVKLGFALAWYQRDHGKYPKELADLTPKYLAKVPSDLFSGGGLIYRPEKDGYLFYSVGVNGQDDGGRSYDDDPPGDDLSVRIPVPEPRRK
jgi:hypothetical protein